jgi:GntR family transcriptional regulator, transcriptional repressor for pyruvate dehydrogenase complex
MPSHRKPVVWSDPVHAKSPDRSQDQAGATFSQVVRSATLSEKVVASITQKIMDGTLKPGERLVSERELGDQFGVSRTVIREAVRSLVAGGLVEARSGRGLQVAEPRPEAASRAMAMFLHRNVTIDYPRVHEVRTALEIDIAGYAAERATPADVERLTALNDELAGAEGDVERAAELDVEFHRAIAQTTQNDLFPILLDAIGPVLLEVRIRAFAAPDLRGYALEAHREILAGIAAGDPEQARDAMRRHLETGARAWSPVEPATSS